MNTGHKKFGIQMNSDFSVGIQIKTVIKSLIFQVTFLPQHLTSVTHHPQDGLVVRAALPSDSNKTIETTNSSVEVIQRPAPSPLKALGNNSRNATRGTVKKDRKMTSPKTSTSNQSRCLLLKTQCDRIAKRAKQKRKRNRRRKKKRKD